MAICCARIAEIRWCQTATSASRDAIVARCRHFGFSFRHTIVYHRGRCSAVLLFRKLTYRDNILQPIRVREAHFTGITNMALFEVHAERGSSTGFKLIYFTDNEVRILRAQCHRFPQLVLFRLMYRLWHVPVSFS